MNALLEQELFRACADSSSAQVQHEPVEDIVREMRAYAKKSEIDGGLIDVWDWLPEFADRIMESVLCERRFAARMVSELRVEITRLNAAVASKGGVK